MHDRLVSRRTDALHHCFLVSSVFEVSDDYLIHPNHSPYKTSSLASVFAQAIQ